MSEGNGSGLATQVKVLVLALTAGAAGAGGLATLGPEVVRPDEFRGADAREMEQRILEKVANQAVVDHLMMMQNIPPDEVKKALKVHRARLFAVEESLRKLDPGFRPDWGE